MAKASNSSESLDLTIPSELAERNHMGSVNRQGARPSWKFRIARISQLADHLIDKSTRSEFRSPGSF